MNKLILILAASTSMALSASSFAAYEVMDSLNYGIKWGNTEAGTTDKENVNGFADNIPLELAIQQVVPEGWSLLYSDDVPRDKLVSWRGYKPWARVMKDLADAANLFIEIQIDGSKILISKSNQKNKLGTLVHKASSTSTKTYAMESKSWHFRKGQYLSDEFSRMVGSVGWTLDWGLGDTKDWMIEADIIINGSLSNVFRQVISAYKAQGVMQRVEVNEHPNNIISIVKSTR